MQIRLGVAMSHLEPIEGAGSLSCRSRGNSQPFPNLPRVLGSVRVRIFQDGASSVLLEVLTPFLQCQILDLDADESKTGDIR